MTPLHFAGARGTTARSPQGGNSALALVLFGGESQRVLQRRGPDARLEIQVRTIGEFNSIASISNLTVFQFPDESIVRLKDVATIKDTFEEQTSYSRYNQQNSITLLVRKKVGHNIVETSLEIENLVEKI